ncbi:hypothetical protein ONS95_008919 [Cadophora gregata]|uniref:uncharacterized protein n=1 Tax=Cadophora gregata TaxID=51156 RepID=UPI0026DC5E28|nr:uncharacterized protein ONS95_008919 [Cadophora gregata]KAK0123929.1 hypothetical protein ONS95_008919 [Cadophora gregata]KAK0130268.1 hypothetical protein ONS96_000791 [Cadophora gregata f. sp. sojae]
MDPFSITGTLIAVLQVTTTVISICYDYRQGVASASREVLQVSSALNSLRDVLESLLALIEQSKSDGSVSKLATIELLANDGGTLESCQQELLRLKKKLEPEAGWRKIRKSLVWPLKETEVKKALEGLERSKSTMLLALSADQTSLSLAIHEQVGGLTEMFEKHSTDQTQQDIKTWLAAPDPFTNHVANRKKRQAHTGTWLLRSKQYENWLTSPKSFLWLYGIPGSGKTVLCSTLVEQLLLYCKNMPQSAIVYFYFDFNDAGKRDVTSLIRSLITQLSAWTKATPIVLLEAYKSYQSGNLSDDDESLAIVLRNLVLTFENVYIVFDALDESSDCDGILQLMHTMKDWKLSRLHILATSRQLTGIEESLTGLVTDKICLQDAEMNEDIVLYVADKLQNDKKLSKWPPDIRLKIQTKLLGEEGGMFQWVVCQLDMLNRCLSVAAVRKALTAGLPKNLDQTYDQILAGIDEEHFTEVMKILQAVTATNDPLTLEDIVEILAVDLDANPPRFDPDSRLVDPRNVLSICSSLVTVQQVTRWPSRTPISVLRLAHASVADYLTQQGPAGQANFHFSRTAARQFLAQSCIGYMMNPEFSRCHKRGKQQELALSYPFLKHCVARWPEYLERMPGDPDDYLDAKTRETVQAFFDTWSLPDGGNYAFWVSCLIPDMPLDYVLNTRPLYYAASFGLVDVVRLILLTEKDADIDALGGRARSSALHVAVYRHHIEVVKILLERGADPSLCNERMESPLYWARNTEMKQLLLKYGAKLDGRVIYG